MCVLIVCVCVCSELAAEISRDYAGRKVLCVGLLTGCFVFLSDLLRHFLVPYEVRAAGGGVGEGGGRRGGSAAAGWLVGCCAPPRRAVRPSYGVSGVVWLMSVVLTADPFARAPPASLIRSFACRLTSWLCRRTVRRRPPPAA